MTRIECERLVERYLEGSLDFAEEENFFIQVALNEELRRTLKAYRIVEETLQKQRMLSGANHAAARSVVAAALVPAFQPFPQQEPSSTPEPQKRKLPWGFVTAITGAALLFGGLFTADQWGQPVTDTPQQVVPAVQSTETVVGTSQGEITQTNLDENGKSLQSHHRKDFDFTPGDNRTLLTEKKENRPLSSPLDPRDKPLQAQAQTQAEASEASAPVVPFTSTSTLPVVPHGQRNLATDSVTAINVDSPSADTGPGIDTTTTRRSPAVPFKDVDRGDD